MAVRNYPRKTLTKPGHDTRLSPQTGVAVERLRNRADFLRARNGARSHERAFVLQLYQRPVGSNSDTGFENGNALRLGFTVTKKIGNAVERNRIKRRLRAAVKAASIPSSGAGQDAVLIARREALNLPFDELVCAITHGLTHAKPSRHKHNVAIQALARQKRPDCAKTDHPEAG